MKRAEFTFNAILVGVDFVMLVAAAWVAYAIRFNVSNLPIRFSIDFGHYLGLVLLVVPIWIIIFALLGLYQITNADKLVEELSKVFVGVSAGLLAVIVIVFVNRQVFSSRYIILASWGVSFLFVGMGRIIIRSIQRSLLERGFGRHRVLIINGNDHSLIDSLKNNRRLGYEIVEVVHDQAPLENLIERVDAVKIDEVIQTRQYLSPDDTSSLIEHCRNKHINFKLVPNLFETISTSNVDFETLGGVPVITIKETPIQGWGKVWKRALDIFVAVIGLLLSSPIMLITALAVKATSRGPVLYKHVRVGQDLGQFQFYKFRSMVDGAEKQWDEMNKFNIRQGPLVKIKNDPRITPVGKFIRKTKLDELPQLLNVLRGDLSLVGPRAHIVPEVQRYQDRYPKLFRVKPGITGLTQVVQTGRADLPFEEEVQLDTYYIENWSVLLDIKILFKTGWAILFHRDKSLT